MTDTNLAVLALVVAGGALGVAIGTMYDLGLRPHRDIARALHRQWRWLWHGERAQWRQLGRVDDVRATDALYAAGGWCAPEGDSDMQALAKQLTVPLPRGGVRYNVPPGEKHDATAEGDSMTKLVDARPEGDSGMTKLLSVPLLPPNYEVTFTFTDPPDVAKMPDDPLHLKRLAEYRARIDSAYQVLEQALANGPRDHHMAPDIERALAVLGGQDDLAFTQEVPADHD